jgi:molybdopterin molybdotransferase
LLRLSVQENLSYSAALAAILAHIRPLPASAVPCCQGLGRFLARDIIARVDSPTRDVSQRDGYAVAEPAGQGWRVTQTISAGQPSSLPLKRGEAARILTGGELPEGALGIIPDETACRRGGLLTAASLALNEKFVLRAGSDVSAGDILARRGESVRPALAGLMVAGGIDSLSVVPAPRVGLVATGDELVLPGQPLGPGQLYASNAVVLQNWLTAYHMPAQVRTSPDHPEHLADTLSELLPEVDALVTSGGAWKSEKDHTLRALAALGWEPVYRFARLAPGKATAFGLLEGKPVFCLPGGPPANELTFLLLALPALLALSGGPPEPFLTIPVTLAEPLAPSPGWTRVHQVSLTWSQDQWLATSTKPLGRMRGPAAAHALVLVTEDRPLDAGGRTKALLLRQPLPTTEV